jgi:hypothetical protein
LAVLNPRPSDVGPTFSSLARAFGSLSSALLGLLRVSFIIPLVALVYGSGRARVPFPPTRLPRSLFCSSGKVASASFSFNPLLFFWIFSRLLLLGLRAVLCCVLSTLITSFPA